MRLYVLVFVLFFSLSAYAGNATINLRLSLLLFPATPLLTIETQTVGNLPLQLESNFSNTHGVNLKWFPNERMKKDYVFIGTAAVSNKLLREDKQYTFLPYVGYGFAKRFGQEKNWTWDTRAGLGGTLNADNNSFYPIVKTGVGRAF